MSTATLDKPQAAALSITQIPLRQIAPSGTNPRKTFNESHLNELAETIRHQGVLQPIIVRPWMATADDVKRARDAGFKPKFGAGDEIHQIVAGECRSRSSILAGKDAIPAIVREMTDADALIIQHVENLQREDLDPLDEADGYRTLMDSGLTQEEIGKRIGKSIQYVSARVRLSALGDDGKILLRKGWISPGHAVLVARLDTPDQEQALRACVDEWGNNKKTPLLELWADEFEDNSAPVAMSEKGLRDWIKDNINLELKKAPWKLDDAELYPEAGACSACEFKSGNNQALFAEIADGDNKCMKPACFQEKRKRYIQIEIKAAKENEAPLQPLSEKHSYVAPKEDAKLLMAGQWEESHKGECPDTILGIFLDGENAGKTKYVCGNVKCKKHKHHIQTSSPSAPRVDYEEENRKREEKVNIERQVRFGRAIEVLKEIKKLDDNLLRLLVEEVVASGRGDQKFKKLLQHAEVTGTLSSLKTSSPEFAKVAAAALLSPHAEPWYDAQNGRKEFNEMIASFGPEFKKMLAEWEKPAKQKPKAPTSGKPKPKPSKKGKKAKKH